MEPVTIAATRTRTWANSGRDRSTALVQTCSTSTATAANRINPSYSASYDSWGNETTRTYNGTTVMLSYDKLDELESYIRPGAYQDGVSKLGSNVIHDEFISKMENGIVSGKNAQGIKVLNAAGPNGQFYQFELKTRSTQGGDWRFYRNWSDEQQQIVFDYLVLPSINK